MGVVSPFPVKLLGDDVSERDALERGETVVLSLAFLDLLTSDLQEERW